jgi:hypothetical protein
MWLLAMAGIPLLVISLDVLTNRRITNWLRELIFTPERTQIYEPRDVIWAWIMGLFGGFLVLWGLKELFAPTKIIESEERGIHLKLGGPGRRAVLIPWAEVAGIRAAEIDDGDASRVEVLVLELANPTRVGNNPWGARWIASGQLAILAEDWSGDAEAVAQRLTDHALTVANERARAGTAALGDET